MSDFINAVQQNLAVDRETRARLKNQKPMTIWLTGLSGAGKSTIANALELELVKLGRHSYLMDGDNIRCGLCSDLKFSQEDRVENIRRVAEVSKLFMDAGLIVINAFISPFRADRAIAKKIIGINNFIEVYIDTPLAECERRDVKGLYGKVRAGLIDNFTGIDSPYEVPLAPDVTLDTLTADVAALVNKILAYLEMESTK